MEERKNADRQKTERIYTVCLENMTFRAFHGCLEEEKTGGNDFRVDFSGSFSSPCGKSDRLQDTVDYGKVYDAIASVMLGERCNLLETLVSRAMDAVSEALPELLKFEIRIAKKNPPVGGPCEWSAASSNFKRDE